MSEVIHSHKREDLRGLILTGGFSKRMGTDKSLLSYHGKPQREHLYDMLIKHCETVFTSCRQGQDVPAVLKPLRDRFNVPGPLNGILTALAAEPPSAWLIVAVDMPFVTDGTLQLLIDNRDETRMATCYFNASTGEPEPLLTLWEPEALPALMEFAKNGNISPREFLKTHPSKIIKPPDSKVLISFNCPDDFRAWTKSPDS